MTAPPPRNSKLSKRIGANIRTVGYFLISWARLSVVSPRHALGFNHAADELIPADPALDRRKRIGLAVAGVDHGTARGRERPEIALGLAEGLETIVRRLPLSLPSQAAHQLVEHEKDRVGQADFERDRHCGECCIPSGHGKIAHMLNGHPVAVGGDPFEGRGGNIPLPGPLDPEIADEHDAFDQRQNIPSGWGLRGLPQPRHGTHGGFLLWLQERIERGQLGRGQSVYKRPVRDLFCASPSFMHQHFEHTGDRQQNSLAPQFREQHLDQPVRFPDGLGDRNQPGNIPAGRSPIEGLVAELYRQLSELLAARLIPTSILFERRDIDPQLIGDEREQLGRRHLVGRQHAAGMPQVAEQHRKAEAAMIATLASDQVEVIPAQRTVPNDLALVRRRRQQACPVLVREQPSSGHLALSVETGNVANSG